ncbi:MAG: PIG-L deacetylase family protein [Actinophytocola sp.]|uniref:PIG-L deacetylase family protein n=1 Tax=Actinophytocola sp. TaxID=1872138 RepID=UPI003D6A174D
MTTPTPSENVRSALVVAAHPDDIDFGAAGTVATWTAAGIVVTYCVCTSGEAGGPVDRDAAEMIRTREAEQRAAAAQVGVTDVVFLRYPDGSLTASIELRRDITRVIRQVRPDRVLAWSPEINWERVGTTHPDHRASGEAAFAAVFPDSRNPHAHRELLDDEGLEPWTVPELWVNDGPAPLRNHAVDITDTFDKKMAALRSHASQVGDGVALEKALRANFGAIARAAGLGEGRYAEIFQVVDTR